MVKALRKAFSKMADVLGQRVRLQILGGEWIDDAYIYRVK